MGVYGELPRSRFRGHLLERFAVKEDLLRPVAATGSGHAWVLLVRKVGQRASPPVVALPFPVLPNVAAADLGVRPALERNRLVDDYRLAIDTRIGPDRGT